MHATSPCQSGPQAKRFHKDTVFFNFRAQEMASVRTARIRTIAEGICRYFTREACQQANCQFDHLPVATKFWDTHCHLDRLQTHNKVHYKDIDFPPNFAGLITNFIDPHLFRMMSNILKDDLVYGTVGYHPQHAGKWKSDWVKELTTLLKHPKVVAVGETGLDAKHASHTPLDKQIPVYRMQLELARDLRKPLVLHCRDEHQEMLNIAKEILAVDQRIHLHCFTGNKDQAYQWIDAFPNLKIGVTNLITNKSMADLREAITDISLEKILLETDAPYMFPKNLGRSYPYKFTHPGMSLNSAVEIAKLKDLSVVEVVNTTTENCKFTYGL